MHVAEGIHSNCVCVSRVVHLLIRLWHTLFSGCYVTNTSRDFHFQPIIPTFRSRSCFPISFFAPASRFLYPLSVTSSSEMNFKSTMDRRGAYNSLQKFHCNRMYTNAPHSRLIFRQKCMHGRNTKRGAWAVAGTNVRDAVQKKLQDQQKTFCQEGIEKLVVRWTLCIASSGQYIGKCIYCISAFVQ